MLIQTKNTLHITAPKTYLLNTEVAGTTIFRMRNTAGFGSSWAIQIGETNEEQTEVLVLSGNPPAIGTLGTSTVSSTFEHPADTPVYAIKFNQVVFERSTTGTAGTATPMTNGTITYQPNAYDTETKRSYTVFDDATGSVSYAYRTYFRNSVLAVTSLESDWITPAGFSFYSLGAMRERIKEKLWDSTYIKDDSQIDNWLNEWLFEMRNAAIAVNEDYALGTVDVGFGTEGLGTITTADFKQPRRMWITYNGADYFQSTKMDINDFVPDEQFSSVHPYHAWRGDTIFQVKPEESGGTARITFYRIGTTIPNDTDELELPMRGYTKSFVDYGLAQAFLKDGKLAESQQKLIEATAAKAQFTQELTPRDKTGVTNIRVVEAINSWDGF